VAREENGLAGVAAMGVRGGVKGMGAQHGIAGVRR